jgi:hypothetical protein
MDPLAPSSPRTYPFPCSSCRGRFQCHCAILEAAGFCFTYRTYVCKDMIEWKDEMICEQCKGQHQCFCDEIDPCPTCFLTPCLCSLPTAYHYIKTDDLKEERAIL